MSDDPEHDIDLEQLKERTTEDVIEGRKLHQKPKNLRILYHDLQWSQREIADFYEVEQPTISRAMNDVGIETRQPMHLRSPSISKSTREDGKVQYHVPDGDGGRQRFYRHQLVGLLSTEASGNWAFTPSEVFADDTHIHHEMASPLALDIPQNLDVITSREHVQLHASGGVKHPELVLAEVFENDGLSSEDRRRLRKRRMWTSSSVNTSNAE